MGGRRTRGAVDFIAEAGTFGYWDFFRGYLLPNLPCLFSADFTEGWGSRRRWVTADGRPDFDYLLRRFGGSPPRGGGGGGRRGSRVPIPRSGDGPAVAGDAVVPVADCDAREFDANPKERMPLRDYLAYWTEHIRRGYASPRGCLYLKDWHMTRSFPRHEAYTTPVHFSSDWLNEYCDARGADDYRFVYMGPRGSWTPFHADVFRSFSWSANVCGRKRWLLFPPGREDLLRDGHGRLPFDATAAAPAPPPLEVIQEAGEVVFVPSGWHHQVYNLVGAVRPGGGGGGAGAGGARLEPGPSAGRHHLHQPQLGQRRQRGRRVELPAGPAGGRPARGGPVAGRHGRLASPLPGAADGAGGRGAGTGARRPRPSPSRS
uniref:Jumonji domain-containing protein 4 n=1 Tax=Ornithorhynchus anatinus TaxID=9258 RepID=A0A6I8NZJ2_ORNAN